MLGLIFLSLVISAFAFKDKPPLERAVKTVLSAAVAQIILSFGINFLLANSLASRGYAVQEPDIFEGFVRWAITTPIFIAIVGGAMWWWFKRNWTEDDDTFE